MLILIVVVSSLVAFTTAQPKPTPPNIPSSFTARGEVEWHTAEETSIGQGFLSAEWIMNNATCFNYSHDRTRSR